MSVAAGRIAQGETELVVDLDDLRPDLLLGLGRPADTAATQPRAQGSLPSRLLAIAMLSIVVTCRHRLLN